MLTPHRFVADKQVEFTIIALCKQPLDTASLWLASVLAQGHRQNTEVILLFSEGDEIAYQKLYWQKLLAINEAELKRSPYHFSYLAIGDHNDAATVAIALNEAVRVANGRWIYLSPTNNQLLKSTFFEFTAAIQTCPDVALISGQYHRLGPKQNIVEKKPPLAPEGFVPETFRHHFLQQNPLSFGSTLFRKSIWLKNYGLKPSFAEVAWWELLRRLVHRKLQWHYIPRPLCYEPRDEAMGQLISHQGKVCRASLQLIFAKQSCYARQETALAQTAIAQYLFQYINDCFQSQDYDRGYQLIFDLLQGINFGDRLWLDTLKNMDDKQLPYKQEIFKIIQLTQQRLIA